MIRSVLFVMLVTAPAVAQQDAIEVSPLRELELRAQPGGQGDDGFGEGNFQALFESIEADQFARGVLENVN